MDKLYEEIKQNKKESPISRLKSAIGRITREKRQNKQSLVYDLSFFALGFVLSRCHLLFGVRPVSLSFLCAMTGSVWPTLMGSVIGGLSLGLNGIIFAVAGAVAIFLRVALGYSEKGGPFKEALSIRMSVATLSGFVVAVFEVLFSGLNEASLLFGLSMILLSPILTFIFSGMRDFM